MDSHIRLILLDFDGTLAFTQQAHAEAFAQALSEAGHTLDKEDYLQNFFGMPCNDFLKAVGISDSGERDRIRERKIELYPTYFDTLRLNYPLWEFCQQFRAQGGRVWIVSTGQPANIAHAMHHLGLDWPEEGQRRDCFPRGKTKGGLDGVLTGADVTRHKPDPFCFEEVMRREGCSPRETLIFEDSDTGIEAARRSGASYFVVTL